jgi:hypothetical protein
MAAPPAANGLRVRRPAATTHRVQTIFPNQRPLALIQVMLPPPLSAVAAPPRLPLLRRQHAYRPFSPSTHARGLTGGSRCRARATAKHYLSGPPGWRLITILPKNWHPPMAVAEVARTVRRRRRRRGPAIRRPDLAKERPPGSQPTALSGFVLCPPEAGRRPKHSKCHACGQPRAALPGYSPSPSRLIAVAARCTGGWHARQRQPRDSCRSVHQRVPWHARHQAPGGGGVTLVVLGICASPGDRSLTSVVAAAVSAAASPAAAAAAASRRWCERTPAPGRCR